MSEARKPVTTLADLDSLDSAEIAEGYRDGADGEPEPGGNRSRSYWHGWRNGRVDRGHAKKDAAQAELARVWLQREREGKSMSDSKQPARELEPEDLDAAIDAELAAINARKDVRRYAAERTENPIERAILDTMLRFGARPPADLDRDGMDERIEWLRLLAGHIAGAVLSEIKAQVKVIPAGGHGGPAPTTPEPAAPPPRPEPPLPPQRRTEPQGRRSAAPHSCP